MIPNSNPEMGQQQYSMDMVKERWKENLQQMRKRIKERVGVAAARSYQWRQRQEMRMNMNMNSKAKAFRATAATGGLVFRVFKGNVVFSRLIHGRSSATAGTDEISSEFWASKFPQLVSSFQRFKLLVQRNQDGSAAAADVLSRSLPMPKTSRSKPVQEHIKMEDSAVIKILQAIAVPLVGTVSHVFMHGLNHTEVYGAEKLQEAIKDRPQGQPLITVSNHVASIDDPLVVASIIPARMISNAKNLRWTLCASDRCFTNPIISTFFRCVKVLPVSRGDGVYQKGMEMALSKLNQGDWVHVFPEGTRSRDGGKTIATAKRGVGRLVLDSEREPLVVPFVHAGMQEVMPIGSKVPHVSKKVIVLVGDPIKVDDLIASKQGGCSDLEIYDAISLRIGERLKEMKIDLDQLVHQQSLLNRNIIHPQTIQFTDSISNFMDWEANNLLSQAVMETEKDTFSLQDRITCTNPEDIPHSVSKFDGSYQDINKFSLYANYTGLNGGVVSTLKAFRNPTALMGFAASGLFVHA